MKKNILSFLLVSLGCSLAQSLRLCVAHHLSNLKKPPGALLLVGVLASSKENNSKNGKGVKILSVGEVPKLLDKSKKRQLCILRNHDGSCSDVHVFKHIKNKKRVYQKLFSFAQLKKNTILKALLRDALHWEYIRSPEQAARILERVFILDNYTYELYMWYQKNFLDIPWLNRFKEPL